jgi:hypothetical protein
VRHVTITDADRGIEIRDGGHNTVTQVTLNTHWRTRLPNPMGHQTTGHYGFALLARTQDNLIEESEIRTRFDHNMSLGSFANGNVFSGLLSVSGGLDHHGAAPYENLFTELVLTDTAADFLATDGDGLTDAQERTVYHTDPTRADTDGDGLADGPEAALWGAASAADADRDGLANLLEADADNDGEPDGAEPQPGTDPVPPAAGPVYRWLEAEAARTRTAPLTVAADPGASGGQYLGVPEGQGNRWNPATPGGEAHYQFTVPVAGTYVVWGRVRSHGGTADSFFVALDAGSPLLWLTRAGGRETWGWDRVRSRGQAFTRFTLPAGTHTLRLLEREDGTKLDRLLITNDLQFVPR